MALGVMSTPAMAVDDKVIFKGKSPGISQLKKYFI